MQRTLYISSNPTGALVTVNGNELGRTPIQRDFIWYGTFDVQVRLEGYQTLDTKSRVIAPWWQWPPFDLAAEFWPGRLHDQRRLHYSLAPASTDPADVNDMMFHALELREKLESSPYTRKPATTRSATTQSSTTQASTTQASSTQASTTQSGTQPMTAPAPMGSVSAPLPTPPPTVQPSKR